LVKKLKRSEFSAAQREISMDGGQFSFGRFRLDLERRRLLRDEQPVRLGSRALEILCVLAEADGRVVSKDELMGRVWPGTAVEENNLHVHISALRKTLDEEGDGQSCLVTLPGRGYRLIASVAQATSDPITEDPSRPTLVPGHETCLCCLGKPSIAVLAFSNWSGDPEQEYFTDGIADDIITALSRHPSLFVIARSSSFTYKYHPVDVKQMGCELGVRYVLEGGLRKSGNRIRVTAQLVDAETGKDIWADRYDRDLADVFAVQDQITEAVTMAIAPAIAEAERRRAMRMPPGSLDAWAAYQRGLWHFYKISPQDNALAQKYFQQAIDIDANFAAGYKGLAWRPYTGRAHCPTPATRLKHWLVEQSR
jgi:TolB-like protein/DNA-binding winged helix-turn-helix (wHTH) protein